MRGTGRLCSTPNSERVEHEKINVQLFQSWEIIKYCVTPAFHTGLFMLNPFRIFLHQTSIFSVSRLNLSIVCSLDRWSE